MKLEIHYQYGIANAIIKHWVCNGAGAISVYKYKKGKYFQWHEDPEYGNWPNIKEISFKTLEEIARNNPKSIEYLKILNKNKCEVINYLVENELEAKHLDSTLN